MKSKRRRLGQHHLLNEFFMELIINKAEISRDDVVFELGSGSGPLTELLCKRAKKVISCELDSGLYQKASLKLSRFRNLELIQADGFNLRKRFDIFISNLPYSESSRFIQWSLSRNFKRAVITVQKEFAEKLLAQPGEKMYRAISVIAQARFRIEPVVEIPNDAFYPVPRVSSKILVLKSHSNKRLNPDTIFWLKKLFSFHGRRVFAALKTFSKIEGFKPERVVGEVRRSLEDQRVEDLRVDEALSIAENLSKIVKNE